VNTIINKRLPIAWLVLTLLTMCYLWIDHAADGDAARQPSALATTAAIIIALVKVRVIFREFMEVRHAPALLCHLTDGWLLLIGAALLGSYLLGAAMR